MSFGAIPARPSRTRPWLDGTGDWSWPGRRGRSSESLSPPSWIPALPGQLRPALAGAPMVAAPARAQRPSGTWLMAMALLGALATAWSVASLGGQAWIERVAGAAAERASSLPSVAAPPDLLGPSPALEPIASDTAGSSIERASFPSGSLDGEGSFFVYLPPGYARSASRYPVLYLLHGRDGHANAFLEIGIQRTLDRLIDEHAIPPMIAVMIQDLPGLNNWRNIGKRHSETYVVEVQELVDRMLRTVPARYARAIAGSSYGGFGAMNVALANPLRFAVVESWLGFFNNLEAQLHADAPLITRLGLHAFLYGAAEDPVAVPAEDPEFAAELRAAGAQAQSAIYPGGHSLEKVKAHLAAGLLFAGRSLRESQQHAAAEAAGAG